MTGNTISCSGHQDSLNCPGARTRYPAIFLDGGSFDFTTIGTNQGSQNGMDAIDHVKKGSSAQNGAVADPDRIVRMQVAADAK